MAELNIIIFTISINEGIIKKEKLDRLDIKQQFLEIKNI